VIREQFENGTICDLDDKLKIKELLECPFPCPPHWSTPGI